ncbi:hypothetical protein HDU87_004018 [Geranomyces variabilis]|uniref:Uncharacterized protein n=1 Tax=Geranomyces variabilis TaxID=109894 RepID=A0AAD5TR06_9FUNG|nr:hypothetical protein HDU87_004018 [Geranomyces variabilis]
MSETQSPFWAAEWPNNIEKFMAVFQDPIIKALWVHSPIPSMRKYVETRAGGHRVDYVIVNGPDEVSEEWVAGKRTRLMCTENSKDAVEKTGFVVYATVEETWKPQPSFNNNNSHNNTVSTSIEELTKITEALTLKTTPTNRPVKTQPFRGPVVVAPPPPGYSEHFFCSGCDQDLHRDLFSKSQRKMSDELRMCVKCTKLYENGYFAGDHAAAASIPEPLFRTWKEVGEEIPEQQVAKVKTYKRVQHYQQANVRARHGSVGWGPTNGKNDNEDDGDAFRTSTAANEFERAREDTEVAVVYRPAQNGTPAYYVLKIWHDEAAIVVDSYAKSLPSKNVVHAEKVPVSVVVGPGAATFY